MKKKIPCDYAQLHLITYENYSDYVELPDYVVEKHKNGTISRAHFSDVLRFSLLKTYGGMWIDSTAFSFVEKQIFNFLILYTIAFCFGGKNMIE